MSPALVAALREVYAEWARGNFRAGRELLDPEERMRQTLELVAVAAASTSMGPFMVWTFRDGLAVRQQWFPEREEALQAGGLAT